MMVKEREESSLIPRLLVVLSKWVNGGAVYWNRV